MKKISKIIAILCVFCLVLTAFAACSGEAESVMTLGDKSISVNVYQLLLCRMKGTLYNYGYDVENQQFWRTIITADGATYDDYFTASIKEQASRYLIADYLFDLNGLVLTEERIETVDKLMDIYVKQAGSKSQLNATLKTYGVNYDILRDLLILETKIDMLKDHLYGNNGELLEDDVKEDYLKENYVAFGQIFLATYSYVPEKDEFGDRVYYTDEKYTAIAYDEENGQTKTDEFGKVIVDKFKNPQYFNYEGKISYDTENGVAGYETETDSEGNVYKKTENYSLAEIEELAVKIDGYLKACDGDIDAFSEHAEIYGEGESDGEITYLYSGSDYYGSIDSSLEYLDEIAEGVVKSNKGDCFVVQSEYGFHLICKYDIEQGAYDDEKHKDTFSDFYYNLIAILFDEECAKYESSVIVNEDALESAPTISEVEVDLLY